MDVVLFSLHVDGSAVYGSLSFCVFFFKQKTAYEMRISDWSSDVCSSDLSQTFFTGKIKFAADDHEDATRARKRILCNNSEWNTPGRHWPGGTSSLTPSPSLKNGCRKRWPRKSMNPTP